MLRRSISLAVLTLVCFAIAWSADATGKWTGTFDTQIGEQKHTWDLTADGTKLTGKYASTNGEVQISDGKIQWDDLFWAEMLKFQDMELRIEYKAKLTGDELKITRKVADVPTEEGVAKRVN
jgi:hypothetical protein